MRFFTFKYSRSAAMMTVALLIGLALGPTLTLAQSNQVVSTGAGTLTTSKPFIGAQTWNAGGVSFMGLQLNISETASAAGSHYIDVNGGATGVTSEWFIAKGGSTTQLGILTVQGTGTVTASTPSVFAQTWNSGGVSFMGLQINTTETADAAGSHYLDINGGVAGATSEFFVAKGGAFTAAGAFTGTVATLAAGTQTTSLPNAVTQTWNAGGVTFAGWTETITETAAAAASTYINILGGAAGTTPEWSVILGGKTTQAGQATIAATTNQLVLGTTNTTTLNFGAPAASTVLTGPNIGPSNAASIPAAYNCGSTGSGNQTCSPAAAGGVYHVISGQSTLSSNAAVITFPAGMVFTSTTSFACTATDQTTVTNPVKAVPSAANTMTLTDTTGASDVIGWVCAGT